MQAGLDPSSATRRDFMAHGITGLVGAGLAPLGFGETAQAAGPTTTPPSFDGASPRFDPRGKLSAISARAKQLWTVVYVETESTLEIAERDVEASLEGGADAVVLEIGRNVAVLARAVSHIRSRYPAAKVGVNYLGDDQDPYGYVNGFRIARDFDAHIVWTDFSGVDLVREVPAIDLHTLEAARPANAFYCSGIHMKYGTLLDPAKSIERSAFQAMGWVEGIVITGPRTGIPTDPDRARRARGTIGAYPMGAASGVSADNFDSIREYVDFCLVNTSIADADHRIVTPKVRELRRVMG